LAFRIGVSERAVHQWLAGEREPMVGHFILTCEVLGVEPSYLWKGKVDADQRH
jgi:hypothetical protein